MTRHAEVGASLYYYIYAQNSCVSSGSSTAPKITSLSTTNAADKGSNFEDGPQTKCGLRGKPCLCEGSPGCHAGAWAEALLIVLQGYLGAGGAGYKLEVGIN